MKNNFDFLQKNTEFNSFSQRAVDCEKSILINPYVCAILCRATLECAVKWVYSYDENLQTIYNDDNISDLIHAPEFVSIINNDLLLKLKQIIKIGNDAIHNNDEIVLGESIVLLRNLFDFCKYISNKYSIVVYNKGYDESILNKMYSKKSRIEEIENVYEDKIYKKNKEIEQMKIQLKGGKTLAEEIVLKPEKTNKDNKNNSTIITNRSMAIEELSKKYKKIQYSSESLEKMKILQPEIYSNEFLNFIEKLNSDIDSLNLTLLRKLGHTSFMEKNTSFGVVSLIVENKKIYVHNIELLEKYEKNPFVEKVTSEKIQKELNNEYTIYGIDAKNKFHDLIRMADREILIASHLATNDVYAEVIGMLEKAVKRGVVIKVLYGMNGDKPEVAQRTLKVITNYKSKLGKNFIALKSNVFQEVCICDDDFFMSGNFGFLSYTNDNKNKNIKEYTTYSENQNDLKKIKKQFKQM